jgi:hypothetical protein
VPRSRVELCAAIRRDARAGVSGRALGAQVLRGRSTVAKGVALARTAGEASIRTKFTPPDIALSQVMG